MTAPARAIAPAAVPAGFTTVAPGAHARHADRARRGARTGRSRCGAHRADRRTRAGPVGRRSRADERHRRRADGRRVRHRVPGRRTVARDVEHQHARGQDRAQPRRGTPRCGRGVLLQRGRATATCSRTSRRTPCADGHFVGVTPGRLLDTCTGQGTGTASPVGPGATIDLGVLGSHGVPASGVSTVVLNVTVDQPTEPSYVTVWPSGGVWPDASNLNMVARADRGQPRVRGGRRWRSCVAVQRTRADAPPGRRRRVRADGCGLPAAQPDPVMAHAVGLGVTGPVGGGRPVMLDLRAWLPNVAVSGAVLNVTAAARTRRASSRSTPVTSRVAERVEPQHRAGRERAQRSGRPPRRCPASWRSRTSGEPPT